MRPFLRPHSLRTLRRFATTPHPSARPLRPPTTTLHPPLPLTSPPPCTCAPHTDPPLDTSTPLANSAPRYARHILLSSSRTDWPTKVELDPTFPLAGHVKALFRGSEQPTLVTASTSSDNGAYVFDIGTGGRWVDDVGAGDREVFEGGEEVRETVVVVCTHMGRDVRCGIVGGEVLAEFERLVKQRGLEGRGAGRVRVLGSSHLSGHKWAGNVIVYRPEGWAVWYGRVLKEGVGKIVEDTVLGGKVVGGVMRGVLGREVEERVREEER